MPADELLQGLQLLQNNVKELAATRSLTNANEAVQQIRLSGLDEAEQQNQLRTVAQDLTFKMAGLGVPGTTIEQIGSTLTKSKDPVVQSAEQAFLMGSPGQKVAAQELLKMKFDNELKLEGAKTKTKFDLEEGKQDARIAKEKRSTLTNFQKQFTKVSTDIQAAAKSANSAIKLLDSGSTLTSSAIGILMARASGEKGPLTEAEQNLFKGQSDLISRVRRSIDTNSLSKLPTSDRAALKKLAQQYAQSAQAAEEEAATLLTNQISSNELFVGDDLNDLASKVTGKRIKQLGASTAAPANNIITKKLKDGTTVQVRDLGNGKYEQVGG